MRTTAILNLKGGVGKTCTAIHAPAIISQEYGLPSLMIDADHQCNLSTFFDVKPKDGNLYDALTQPDGCFAAMQIQHTALYGLDILAGSPRLMDLDLSQLRSDKVYPTVLRDMVEELARREWYEHILIDCPPAFSAASAAALMAADDVLIPIKLDAFSLDGMANVIHQINNMRKINPKLRIAGILPTMFYKNPHVRKAEEELRKSKLHVFPHIRRSASVDSMTFTRSVLSSCHSGSEIDYRRFVAEFLDKETKK